MVVQLIIILDSIKSYSVVIEKGKVHIHLVEGYLNALNYSNHHNEERHDDQ